MRLSHILPDGVDRRLANTTNHIILCFDAACLEGCVQSVVWWVMRNESANSMDDFLPASAGVVSQLRQRLPREAKGSATGPGVPPGGDDTCNVRDTLMRVPPQAASTPLRIPRLAAKPLAQLAKMRACDPEHAQLYTERADAVTQHFAGLSMWQSAGVALKQLMESVWFGRRSLNEMIHPAISAYARTLLPGDSYGDYLVDDGMAERVHFFTRDHMMLDGLLVGPSYGASLPVVMIGLGNGMVYQSLLPAALEMAQSCGARVLLYNDRGIGRSLGAQHSTGQAVLDCRAALNFAQQRSGQHLLDIFGISLGGGITARALEQAEAAGELCWQDVGCYVNCHSFTSLSACVGGLMGAWVGRLARSAFWLTGFDNLDALHALTTCRLARNVVVFTADQDEFMRGGARLGEALAAVGVPNHVTLNTESLAHNNLQDYFNPNHLRMHAWARVLPAS